MQVGEAEETVDKTIILDFEDARAGEHLASNR